MYAYMCSRCEFNVCDHVQIGVHCEDLPIEATVRFTEF